MPKETKNLLAKHITRQEMESRIKEKGIRVLDNFWTRMPGEDFGNCPRFNAACRLELEAFNGLNFDQPYRDQDPNRDVSEKFLSLTPRQFHAIVYSVMASRGITKEKALDLREQRQGGQISQDQLLNKILPAFLKLIEMGFNENDLTV